MMRRALTLGLLASGLSGIAWPLLGYTRRIAPLRVTGWPEGRRTLWLRNAPPSADGGVCVPPTPTGGSPHTLSGVPPLPPNCP